MTPLPSSIHRKGFTVDLAVGKANWWSLPLTRLCTMTMLIGQSCQGSVYLAEKVWTRLATGQRVPRKHLPNR